jgi:16S rRNA (cytosine1402-N4)-methyltransferase
LIFEFQGKRSGAKTNEGGTVLADFSHTPVLLDKCVEFLSVKPDGVYLDGTLGGAGHSSAIAEKLASGMVIGLDQDAQAIDAATERLKPFGSRAKIVKSNFQEAKEALDGIGIKEVDGILLDLGVSSWQLDEGSRGFSFNRDGRLDMRMDSDGGLTACDVVNIYDESRLADIFFQYGEEKLSRRIAARIVAARAEKPLESTYELASVVRGAFSKKALAMDPHPERRVFQAVRIEVNQELAVLERALEDMLGILKSGGRICVISYHSLEDRIVKTAFRRWENPCTCPPDFPVCVCGKKPLAKILTKKPVAPSEAEMESNKRSRSAKLRSAEKI